MRQKLIDYLTAQGYSRLDITENNQNYIWLTGITPNNLWCDIRFNRADNSVWDRTKGFWDQIGEVNINENC